MVHVCILEFHKLLCKLYYDSLRILAVHILDIIYLQVQLLMIVIFVLCSSSVSDSEMNTARCEATLLPSGMHKDNKMSMSHVIVSIVCIIIYTHFVWYSLPVVVTVVFLHPFCILALPQTALQPMVDKSLVIALGGLLALSFFLLLVLTVVVVVQAVILKRPRSYSEYVAIVMQ